MLGAVVITRATNKSRQLKTEQSTHTYRAGGSERRKRGEGTLGKKTRSSAECLLWRATRVSKYQKSNKNGRRRGGRERKREQQREKQRNEEGMKKSTTHRYAY